jgi:hypothetical protein
MLTQQWGSLLRSLYAVTALVVGLTTSAQAITLDFESDTTGSKPNGFQSVGSPLVRFSDSLGSDLFVDYFASGGEGKSLAVYADDASGLVMDFLTPMDSLQLDFGNDDPEWSMAGDLAVLKLFSDGTLIGQTTVELNRDDVMNQSIAFSGSVFNQATFLFDVHPMNGAAGLIEMVDNVTFTPVAHPNPEPGTIAVLGAGVLPLLGAIRRRREVAALPEIG